ncbi:MAG: hypothetical protein WCU88_11645 [Elusimicrobiota bacterium]|jgi:hypothetical protein
MKRTLGIWLIAYLILSLAAQAAPKKQQETGLRVDYSSWRDFFTSISPDATPDGVFDFAVGSEVVETGPDRQFFLVEPSGIRFDGTDNGLRGGTGNGPYYLLRRHKKGLRLIGTMFGNMCKFNSTITRDNSKTDIFEFECSWHNSWKSRTVTRYETTGESLKEIDHREVAAEDGKP